MCGSRGWPRAHRPVVPSSEADVAQVGQQDDQDDDEGEGDPAPDGRSAGCPRCVRQLECHRGGVYGRVPGSRPLQSGADRRARRRVVRASGGPAEPGDRQEGKRRGQRPFDPRHACRACASAGRRCPEASATRSHAGARAHRRGGQRSRPHPGHPGPLHLHRGHRADGVRLHHRRQLRRVTTSERRQPGHGPGDRRVRPAGDRPGPARIVAGGAGRRAGQPPWRGRHCRRPPPCSRRRAW